MKVNKYQDELLDENRIDVYYREEDVQIQSLFKYLGKNQSLVGIKDGVKRIISPEEVYYFEAVEKRCFAYLQEDIYQVEDNLHILEEKYMEIGFVRVNKATMVNILKIAWIKAEVNMRVSARLENGESIIINRSYKKNFNDRLKALWNGGKGNENSK